MGFIQLIGVIFKIISQLLSLRKEKNKELAEKKAENVNKIVNAFKETDPTKRDRDILSTLDDINRM